MTKPPAFSDGYARERCGWRPAQGRASALHPNLGQFRPRVAAARSAWGAEYRAAQGTGDSSIFSHRFLIDNDTRQVALQRANMGE